ncbi:hypothetical protein I0292_26555 (plasmid) [Priestia megaterium]|uniref:hypothetical protein n=1 Tax=Priestia megaterium TaxID=1404 RepID=UPI0020494B17|nr:hypothetical protein [Priestia megaterium]UOO43811.1 hypothetical protein I0292_26555 [Priestia megaterium]
MAFTFRQLPNLKFSQDAIYNLQTNSKIFPLAITLSLRYFLIQLNKFGDEYFSLIDNGEYLQRSIDNIQVYKLQHQPYYYYLLIQEEKIIAFFMKYEEELTKEDWGRCGLILMQEDWG